MITLLNRKELMRTYDEGKYHNIKDKLDEHHIKYDIKVNYLKMATTAHLGGPSALLTPGQQTKYEYIIYVKKDQFDKALIAL